MELRMKNVSTIGVHRKIQLLGVAGGWNLGARFSKNQYRGDIYLKKGVFGSLQIQGGGLVKNRRWCF